MSPHLRRQLGLVGLLFLLLIAPAGPARGDTASSLLGSRAPVRSLPGSLRDLAQAWRVDGATDAAEVADRYGLRLVGDRVLVVIEYQGDAKPLCQALIRFGAQIGTVATGRLSALVPIASLQAAAGVPGVHLLRAPLPISPTSTTSEGVAALGAQAWHKAGYNGQGVTAAVVDMGYAGWEALQASGDLPPGDRLVQRNMKFEGFDENGQHGSAVAEVLYDMAPGVDRLILYALDEDPDLEAIVDDMLGEGVQVAAMSLGWANASPYDGTGFLCDQVNRAAQEGIFWAVAAGNQAHMHYEGAFTPFQDTPSHAFATDTDVNALGVFLAGSQLGIALSWNEWPTATSNYDLDIVRYDTSDWVVEHTFQDDIASPTEGGFYTVQETGLYGARIEKVSGDDRYLELYYLGGDLLGLGLDQQVPQSSLMTPADADGAVAVGAFGYSKQGEIEFFSSQGPRNAIGGGPWEGTCPDPHCKPDLAGPDGNKTVSYGSLPFYGTSSAAPHVGGAAALVWGAYPSLTRDQVLSFLESRAVDEGEPGDDNAWGLGRVQLGAAPGDETPVIPTATATPSHATPTSTTTAPATATPTGAPPATSTPGPFLSHVGLPLLLKALPTLPTPTPIAQEVTLRIAPPLVIGSKGSLFSFQIQLDAEQQPVDAAEIIIEFTSGQVTVVGPDGQPVTSIAPGQGLDEVLWNRVDNEQGRIVYMARRTEGPFPSATIALGTFWVLVNTDDVNATLSFSAATDVLFGGRSVLGEMYGARIIHPGGLP